MQRYHYGACLGATLLGSVLLIATHGARATAAGAEASANAAHSKKPAHSKAERIPTFNKDIAPIVFAHCTTCHRPGQAAPFTLMNYHDAKLRGLLMANITKSGLMPPWKAGKSDCELKDVNLLTETQIALIQRWVNSGMKEGASADLPKLPSFPEGWQLGKPDLIVKMSRPYHVPADGPDIYRTFVVPLNLTEDKWVTAIEYHPSARKSVHHCLFYFDATGKARLQDGKDGEPGIGGALPSGHRHGFGQHRGGGLFGGGGGGEGGLLGAAQGAGLSGGGGGGLSGALSSSLGGDGGSANMPGTASFGSLGGWAVGANAQQLPDGLAYHLPKGSDLILSTHFHMSGKPEEEASEIGLYFAKKAPEKQFASIQLPPVFGAIEGIDIPAGTKDWVPKDSFTLPVDVKAFGVTGHAHMVARTMLLTATLPDGSKKTLFTIPNWDFAWQGQYQYKQFTPLPKGTRLDVVIHYDNSADNPHNPYNPPRPMRWGPQSTDEMGSINLEVVAVNEQDMPALKQAYVKHVFDQVKERLSKSGGSGGFGGFGGFGGRD